MKESIERARPVSSLEPSRCGVGGLLIPVAAILWETPHPERRVDFGNHRFALRNLPSVERPEVNRSPALLPEVQEPGETSMRRGCHLSLHSETKDGLGGGSPLLGDPEPASLPGSLPSLPCLDIANKTHVRVPRVGWPVMPEVFEEALPVAG